MYFRRDKYSPLSGLHFLATRSILNTDEIEEFLEWEKIKINERISNKEATKKIIKWLHRKKQGLKDYFRKNIKNSPTEYYKKVDRVTTPPHDSPDWLREGIEEDPSYLHTNEVFRIRGPLRSDTKLVTKIDHIVDYFVWYLVQNPGKSLDNVTWAHMIKGLEKWEESYKNKKETQEVLSGEKMITESTDGFKWYELTDKRSMINEGSRMDHCVGSHCEYYQGKGSVIYSLRDPSNHPHATIEYSPGKSHISQLKGKNNDGISSKYTQHIKSFIQYLENKDGSVTIDKTDFSKTGLFYHENEIHDLNEVIPTSTGLKPVEEVEQDELRSVVSSHPIAAKHVTDTKLFDYIALTKPATLEYVSKVDPQYVLSKLESNPDLYVNLHPNYRAIPKAIKTAREYMFEHQRFEAMYSAFPRKTRNSPEMWRSSLKSATLLYDKNRIVDSLDKETIIEFFNEFLKTFEIDPRRLFKGMTNSDLDGLLEKDSFKTFMDNNKYFLDWQKNMRLEQFLYIQMKPDRLEEWKQVIQNGGTVDRGSQGDFNFFDVSMDLSRSRDKDLAKKFRSFLKTEITSLLSKNPGKLREILASAGTSYANGSKTVAHIFLNDSTDVLEKYAKEGVISYFDLPTKFRGSLGYGVLAGLIEQEISSIDNILDDPRRKKFWDVNITQYVNDNSKLSSKLTESINIGNVWKIIEDTSIDDKLRINVLFLNVTVTQAFDDLFRENFDGDKWEKFSSYLKHSRFAYAIPAGQIERKALEEDFEKNYLYSRYLSSLLSTKSIANSFLEVLKKSSSLYEFLSILTESKVEVHNLVANLDLSDKMMSLIEDVTVGGLQAYWESPSTGEFLRRILGDKNTRFEDYMVSRLVAKDFPFGKLKSYVVDHPKILTKALDIDYSLVEWGPRLSSDSQLEAFGRAIKRDVKNLKYFPIWTVGEFGGNVFDLQGVISRDPSTSDILFLYFKQGLSSGKLKPTNFHHGIQSFEEIPEFYDLVANFYKNNPEELKYLINIISDLDNSFEVIQRLSGTYNLYELYTVKWGGRERVYFNQDPPDEFWKQYVSDFKDYVDDGGIYLKLDPRAREHGTLDAEVDMVKKSLEIRHKKPKFLDSLDLDVLKQVIRDPESKKKLAKYMGDKMPLDMFPVLWEDNDLRGYIIEHIKLIAADRRWYSQYTDVMLQIVNDTPELSDLLYNDLLDDPYIASNAGDRVLPSSPKLYKMDKFRKLLDRPEFDSTRRYLEPKLLSMESSLLRKIGMRSALYKS